MKFLYFLEGLRTPFFNWFFETITHLGEETLFLVIAIVFFWCVNKREGYYILLTGLYGTLINQTLKLTFRIDRPFVKDPNFHFVGNSNVEATGYSFPSGHTQNIAGTYGSIAAYNRKKWLTAACVILIVLVAFSRMYLGVHTPLDVFVSLGIALALVLALRPFFASEERFERAFPYFIVISVVLSIAYLVYTLCLSGDTTLDAHNYNSGLKNACTLFGCMLGLVLVYFIDTKFTRFETNARWYAQIIKAAVGFGIVLAIKSGLSAPLTALFRNEYVARVVRYFLIVGFAGAVWPLTFKWFGTLKIDFLERFGDWVVSLFVRKDRQK